MFTPRLTRPEKGNLFYITRDAGGYSTAIKGYPLDSLCNALANCVGYAVGRFHEIANRPQFDLIDPVNAENLYQNAQQHGLKVGTAPALGALIVWQKGETLSGSDGAGHVAVVEQINADGSIITSESGYGAMNPFWTTARRPPYNNGTGYKLLGFVYLPPSQNPYPEPTRVLKKGCVGSDVKWLQYELLEAGYTRSTEVDGDFGNITLGAVCAFQLENGLEVDGVCGPATQAALKSK